LHDTNVLLRDISGGSGKTFTIKYPTSFGYLYLKTDKIATLIDYATSHIKYNNEHFGIVSDIFFERNVLSQESLPMHDAYRLLCASIRRMIGYKNISCINEAAKILRFFTDENIYTVIKNQIKTSFMVPYTEQIKSLTHEDLVRYIRQNIDCSSFLFENKPKNVQELKCDTCLQSDFLTSIGFSGIPSQKDFFEYYDFLFNHDDDPLYDQVLNKLRNEYSELLPREMEKYIQISIDINNIFGNIQLIRSVREENLVNIAWVKQYADFLSKIARLLFLRDRLLLYNQIIYEISNLVGDYNTSERVSSEFQVFRNRMDINIKQLTDLATEDNRIIDIMISNLEVQTKNPILEWLMIGRKSFDFS